MVEVQSAPVLPRKLVDGDIDCREEVTRIERPDQLVALELRADGILELSEYEEGTGGVEFLVEVGEHVGRGSVDIGDRLGGDHDPLRARLGGGETADLISERSRVGEEQRSVEAE